MAKKNIYDSLKPYPWPYKYWRDPRFQKNCNRPTGGISGTTSEFVGGFIDDELKTIPGPELPMEFSGHCSVKINQTHVLLTGTADYFNGDQTLVVDVSSTDNYTSMIFGSKMNQKRHYHACGTFIHEVKFKW